MDVHIDRLGATFGSYLPNLLAALAVLVLGTLVAWGVSVLVRTLLKKTTLDDRLAAWLAADSEGAPPKIEGIVSTIVFWLLEIFVLVGFFQMLGLAAIAGPLDGFLDETIGFLPNLVGAAVLVLAAWLVARVLRFLVKRGVMAAGLNERLARHSEPGDKPVNLATSLGESVYWLTFLLFLPAILDALNLDGLLAPVDQLLREVMAFLPNLLAAVLILGVGWFFARVLQRIVASLLAASGIDSVSERVGLQRVSSGRSLSSVIALVVYVIVLIPVIVAALQALEIDALTRPASEMLNQVLLAIPRLFAAALVIGVAYFVGKLLAGFVANLLAAAGFDEFLYRIGLMRRPAIAATPTLEASANPNTAIQTQRRPSEIVGWIVLTALVLFSVIEALSLLEFEALAAMVAGFTVFAGNVLLALVIFGLGYYLAGLAASAIRSSGVQQPELLSTVARVAILVLSGAMALRQAGVAEDIILLAFGLTLGAAAVAAAIAFGIGGRDLARQSLERWSEQVDGRPNSRPAPTKPPLA